MLKALAGHLMERKEEFYALSKPTGATRTDAWIDVEGGIGTLFAYASKGRRELPNATFHLDGAPEPLAKGGTFVGQHICVPLEGAAVHINAFNFPAWGMLEKLAPTLLAGLPAIVKPASQTAYVAEAMVRRIVESGILPEGSLQLICGGDRRPVRAPDRPGRGHLHRLGRDRPPPAHPSQGDRALGPLHHGGRLAQLLPARPRRRSPAPRSSTSSSRRSRAR